MTRAHVAGVTRSEGRDALWAQVCGNRPRDGQVPLVKTTYLPKGLHTGQEDSSQEAQHPQWVLLPPKVRWASRTDVSFCGRALIPRAERWAPLEDAR